jgi:hypothetical protein
LVEVTALPFHVPVVFIPIAPVELLYVIGIVLDRELRVMYPGLVNTKGLPAVPEPLNGEFADTDVNTFVPLT